ncbi:MAG: hypothetical protein ACLP59_02380 [Bryobacteraceae bacterium]
MPKTVVGLFENPAVVDDVVSEIEALGFPQREVRTVAEPAAFDVTSVMSFPRVDFETHLLRELTRVGAAEPERRAYIEGLRRGGALVLATGLDEKVDAAAGVMNRHGAVGVEQTSGSEPEAPHLVRENRTSASASAVMTGRVRQTGGGARLFVW